MATITLTGNTSLSALTTLANNDTIALAGFTLDINTTTAITGVSVTTVGTAGTVTFSSTGVNANLSTWSFTAGTGVLIATVPAGVTIGTVTGGTAANARAVTTNSGTITNPVGGSGNAAVGVNTNNGTVSNATGGSAVNAHGISVNSAIVTNCTGGSISGAHGIGTNNGTVSTATGGSTGSADGVFTNNCVVTTAIGGSGASTAYGVFSSLGEVFSVTPGTSRAVGSFSGGTKVIFGPTFNGVFTASSTAAPTTIYSIGALSGSATIPGGITVIEVNTGGGGYTYNQVKQLRYKSRSGVMI